MKKSIVIIVLILLSGWFVQGQNAVDELLNLPIHELAKRSNWSLIEQKIALPSDTLLKCMVENKSLFVKENGLKVVDAKLSGVYEEALWRYAVGQEPYDPRALADLFQGIMQADLAFGAPAYIVYDLAKYRGKKEYDKMLDVMVAGEKKLGKERMNRMDLTLGEIPELPSSVRESFVKYLTLQSGKYKKEKTYQSVIQKISGYKGIVFEEGTFSDALAKAAKEDKLIFLDAYTVWCAPCKLMSEKVFTLEEVGTFFNKNFVNVKMDMEKGEGLGLTEKYNIRAYPTFLLLNANGDLVYQNAGYKDAKVFLDQFRREVEGK